MITVREQPSKIERSWHAPPREFNLRIEKLPSPYKHRMNSIWIITIEVHVKKGIYASASSSKIYLTKYEGLGILVPLSNNQPISYIKRTKKYTSRKSSRETKARFFQLYDGVIYREIRSMFRIINRLININIFYLL